MLGTRPPRLRVAVPMAMVPMAIVLVAMVLVVVVLVVVVLVPLSVAVLRVCVHVHRISLHSDRGRSLFCCSSHGVHDHRGRGRGA